jgi:hypothetical protein
MNKVVKIEINIAAARYFISSDPKRYTRILPKPVYNIPVLLCDVAN